MSGARSFSAAPPTQRCGRHHTIRVRGEEQSGRRPTGLERMSGKPVGCRWILESCGHADQGPSAKLDEHVVRVLAVPPASYRRHRGQLAGVAAGLPPVRNAICPGERWEAVGLAFELRIDLDLAPRPEPAQLLSYLPPDRCVELLTGEGSCSRALSMGCSRLRAPGRPRRWPPCARSSVLLCALNSTRSAGTRCRENGGVGSASTSIDKP